MIDQLFRLGRFWGLATHGQARGTAHGQARGTAHGQVRGTAGRRGQAATARSTTARHGFAG
ncbi:hypothetical protein [Streptomyces sp. 35G-GA-8]|uniref:hypothetical protein n=1 Tax=Streptomyces sp. 35G-GA-8 TaxID=2939434 RepID=UPI00201F66DD|nr:hypothetical protein [Streptomyces sp. 35G-GA-8]MCL7380363.1 hypothetical protein [Streptomyces sp. 35G-GA-8]